MFSHGLRGMLFGVLLAAPAAADPCLDWSLVPDRLETTGFRVDYEAVGDVVFVTNASDTEGLLVVDASDPELPVLL